MDKSDNLNDYIADLPPEVRGALAQVGLGFGGQEIKWTIVGYIRQLQSETRKLREESDGEDR